MLRTGIERLTLTLTRTLILLALVITSSTHASSTHTILVLGDSISAGFGIPVQQGWVALLQTSLQQQVPGVTVHNASVSGETTAGGLTRLPALLQQHQPDLVIIELGGNDALRGMPLPMIEKNLATMITLAEKEGSMVMLLGMKIPPNYGQKYADGFAAIYDRLADRHSTLLLPFLLEGVATRAGLMQADGIHPTAEAQPIMRDAVAAAMEVWIEFANE